MNGSFGYFYNEQLLERETGGSCPEEPDRLRVLSPERISLLARDGSSNTQAVLTSLPHYEFQTKSAEILRAVHDPEYVDEVMQAHSRKRRALDSGDTKVTPDIFEQSLLAASAGCTAIDQVMGGKLRRAFCAVRPPGHHANAIRAMGFCVFNNVAVVARYAQQNYGVERVLILDWDLDPGNGTQEIFWRDPTVFTFSIHQSDLFPAAGLPKLIGAGPGEGFNCNVAIAPGTATDVYIQRFESVLVRITNSFRPQLLVIAAGFDAHQADKASKLAITEHHFGKLTEIALRITEPYTDGRIVSILEGGYNTGALQASVAQHCASLAKQPGRVNCLAK